MANEFFPAPVILNWTLSNRCNFQCSHCYSRLDPTDDDLDFETICRLLDKAAAAKVLSINFGGGEPLLHQDLFAVARHATDLGIVVSLNSNGSLIDGEAAGKLEQSGVKKVGISIDSARADVHDTLQRRPRQSRQGPCGSGIPARGGH